MARVGLVEEASLGKGDHAALARVGNGLGPGQGPWVAVDVVEENPLAERPLAENQLLHAQPLQHRVEEHRSRHQQVGPACVDAGKA